MNNTELLYDSASISCAVCRSNSHVCIAGSASAVTHQYSTVPSISQCSVHDSSSRSTASKRAYATVKRIQYAVSACVTWPLTAQSNLTGADIDAG
jgi:hypothetical protein